MWVLRPAHRETGEWGHGSSFPATRPEKGLGVAGRVRGGHTDYSPATPTTRCLPSRPGGKTSGGRTAVQVTCPLWPLLVWVKCHASHPGSLRPGGASTSSPVHAPAAGRLGVPWIGSKMTSRLVWLPRGAVPLAGPAQCPDTRNALQPVASDTISGQGMELGFSASILTAEF